jgi:hypothetical protein
MSFGAVSQPADVGGLRLMRAFLIFQNSHANLSFEQFTQLVADRPALYDAYIQLGWFPLSHWTNPVAELGLSPQTLEAMRQLEAFYDRLGYTSDSVFS